MKAKLFLSSVLSILFLSSASFASHPTVEEMAEVMRLAHRVATVTEQVHKQAENEAYNGHGGNYQERALVALHRLSESAEHFHHQAEEYYQNPQHTERDFENLMHTFSNTRQELYYAHFSSYVMRNWYRVERSVARLAYMYDYDDRSNDDDDHGRGPRYPRRR
ncbi:MAG: hypothetical protein SGI74_02500 [Oligoflexia bacterium]|nr:hypothetical protein [Oligoflexia bacterium]